MQRLGAREAKWFDDVVHYFIYLVWDDCFTHIEGNIAHIVTLAAARLMLRILFSEASNSSLISIDLFH